MQVVARGAFQAQDRRLVVGRSLGRHGDRLLAGQVLPGDGVGFAQDAFEPAAGDDLATVHAGPGADVHDVVGAANGLLVVLHHQHRVAKLL